MSLLGKFLDAARRFEQAYARDLIERLQVAAGLPGAVAGNPEQGWVPVRGFAAAVAENRRLVVTGASGAGKTTALRQLAVKHAHALLAHRATARIPIFLSASQWSGPFRISDLPRGLDQSPALATQCPPGFFQNALTSGRVLVLIDDLDAVSEDAADALLKELGTAQVVATSRTGRSGWTQFSMRGWRDTDLAAVAQKVHGANARAFLETVKASRVPRALTANPLALALLAQLWRQDITLPNSRTRLFDDYVRSVLGSANETARMLQEAALDAYRGTLPSGDLVERSHGFMLARRDRTVEFKHALWQAYFAARGLRQAPEPQAIAELLSDARWAETVVFYAGMGDAAALIDALVARGDFVLAGRALAQTSNALQVRAQVTRELMSAAWQEDLSAIAALAELNDDAAVDDLAVRLKDKDPLLRAHTARILGELGLDRGVDHLLPQLRDADGDVREQVVVALGHARSDRVIEPLLVALRGESRNGQSDTRLRAAAAHALGQVGSDRALPALIVDLQIGEPEVRAAAAKALRQMTSPLLYKPLLGLTQAGDEETRRYATELLETLDFGF